MVSQVQAGGRGEDESLLASHRSDVLEHSHARREHGSVFSHVDDDDGTTRAEDLPTHYSTSDSQKSSVGTIVFKLALAAFITLIYMSSGLCVTFSSSIPNVQFDFTKGTTKADLYNPSTLKFRKGCGTKLRENGGFQFQVDDEGCWNEFIHSKKINEGQWSADKNREWHGWIRPAPAMDNVGLFVRVNGDFTVQFKVGKSDIKVSGGKDGKDVLSKEISKLDISEHPYFDLVVEFHDEQTIQKSGNKIELLYYETGASGQPKDIAVVLPFSMMVQPDDLTKLAESEPYIQSNRAGNTKSEVAKNINVQSPKGSKYVPQGVIMFVWITFCVVSFIIILVMDLVGGAGFKMTKMCFEWKNILLIAPAAIGWGLADVFEVMALGGLDPVIYGVLSQLRLLLTAILATFIINKVFTKLQWIILSVLTLMIISFSMKGGGGGEVNILSWVFCGLKQLFSVLCGVYGEKYLKGVDRPFVVQFFWIGLAATPFVAAGIFFSLVKEETNVFTYGLFGGYDFGWDGRTIVVFLFYIAHFLATALCCKYLSAVNKNVCNGCALLLLYFTEGILLEKSLDPAKIFLTLAIAAGVVMYALSGAYQKPESTKAAESKPKLSANKK